MNLQSSKKLLKTYDELVMNGLQPIHQLHSLMANEKLILRSNDDTNRHESSSPTNRTSKMVKIEFNENNKMRQNQQIRMKRKMMTSSQKFYQRKKQNYSSYIKQTYHKINEESKQNQTFLTIGSHAIKKMDYTTTVFSKDYKFIEDLSDRSKFKFKSHFNFSQFKSVIDITNHQQPNKVLILRKNQKNRLELVYNHPKTERKASIKPSRVFQKVENVKSSHQKSLSIQEFIPVRKNTSKKQPFVFGLSQKQMNPQKNRDKLLLYHDFLWKINYSNGLYIQPSEDQTLYKAYIGPGNNSNLIKSILKRRFWWSFVEKHEGSNFSWSQLKINSIFRDSQNKSNTEIDKLYSKSLEQQQNLKSQPALNLQEGHQRIFNNTDLINWNRHMRKYRRSQCIINEKTYKNRLNFLSCKEIIRLENSQKIIIHNHLQQNYYIGNKKALFYNMKKYYELQSLNVFEALPLTFHISKGLEDPQFKQFLASYNSFEDRKKRGEDVKNIWIMKPGQNSNRGNGITVCHGLEDVKLRLRNRQKNSDGNLRTFIIQKYMEKPLLYKGRKFDIRHYMLLTCFNGIMKAYWFPQGYIRTSSSLFSLKRGTNLYIHLTNDAVQKNSDEYGKYEKGNKISYQKFQNYLNKNLDKSHNNCFNDVILKQMKHLALESVKATYLTLDPQRKEHNFELLGMDFMIDDCLKPWLIEINTNPCLELSSPLLSKIIPTLIEQTFRICIDPIFPPPDDWPTSKKMYISDNLLEQNQFQLIFDESVDGQKVLQIYGSNLGLDSNMGKIEQDAEVYENDGVEEWQQKH